jgi:hypothetical protein
LRESRRTNRDGSVVRYLQLAHNERHPQTGNPVAKVIHSFGRAEQVDGAALSRLVSWISRFLTPQEAAAAASGMDVEVVDSRRLGGVWAIRKAADGRRLDGPGVERVVFALVAQRALEPSSKLAGTKWVAERVAIEGLTALSDDQAYRAMDFLLDALDDIAGEVFASVAHLLNLDLDIVFVDTTSTYFEVDVPDEFADLADKVDDDGVTRPVEQGTRSFGHSKDFRTDLPQVVIAMAVTRDGVPVRCWTFPSNTADTAIIRTVKDDLAGWNLSRMVWVADRGFASAANRAYLTRGGGHYIHAGKLRNTQQRSRRRPRPPRALSHRRREPAGQGSAGGARRTRRRGRRRPHPTLRGLSQPRAGRPARRRPAAARHPSRNPHRRVRRLVRPAPGRARRFAEEQARAAPLPAPHRRRPAAGRQRGGQARSPSRWQVAAAHQRHHLGFSRSISPRPTSSCCRSNAAGGT